MKVDKAPRVGIGDKRVRLGHVQRRFACIQFLRKHCRCGAACKSSNLHFCPRFWSFFEKIQTKGFLISKAHCNLGGSSVTKYSVLVSQTG